MISSKGVEELRGAFDYDNKIVETNKIREKLSDPKVWKENNLLNELNQELNQLKKTTDNFERVVTVIEEITSYINLPKKIRI